jgi:hypothetical protein
MRGKFITIEEIKKIKPSLGYMALLLVHPKTDLEANTLLTALLLC